MRARLLGVVALAIVLHACGDGQGELRVTGDTPYARCLFAPAPEARSWRAGSLRIALGDDRRLRIDSAPSRWRLAAFAGPVDAAAVEALRGARPHLAVMLGGAGDEPAEVTRTLATLAGLGVPVLFLAGGADRHDALAAAFEALDGEARDRVIDASRLRSVRIGSVELVPLAGAPAGRYALADDACGFAASDMEAVADAVDAPSAGAHRYVLSWAAPRAGSGASASLGVASVEAGSPLVAELIERTRAEGALFAWPHEAAGRADDPLRVAVRPLAGPWVVRGDGTRAAPGATLLEVRTEGLVAPHDSP